MYPISPTNNGALMMSTREIAELTGKRHDHVLRDARNLLAELQSPQIRGDYQDGQGRTYPMLLLDKAQSICLVAGYSAQYRMAIIRRWQELEQSARPTSQLEMIAQVAMEAARIERQVEEVQQQVALVDQQVKDIAAGAIPSGWQTIRNLSAESGLSEQKTRDLIKAFGVRSKKIPFMTPGGIVTNATVADEADFFRAVDVVIHEATRAMRSKYWYHPKLGRFERREVA
ncbi:phage regulatory protein [Edwardsiella tarda]|uniref:Rha family transcriptional regulator n=1 Tax=Edwardsiella tarda TaxID=636 RepID=UPI000BE2C6B1|nr:phage regulatory protein [Edwardsiella tarda]